MICDHGNNIKTLKLSYQVSNQSLIHVPSTGVTQLTLTLKMTTAQVVETSVTVNNSPIQDYDHPDDHDSWVETFHSNTTTCTKNNNE